MKLIPEWRQAWKLYSVQAASLLLILSLVQAQVLPLFEKAVPADWWPLITATFAAGIAILRILSQEPPEETPHD